MGRVGRNNSYCVVACLGYGAWGDKIPIPRFRQCIAARRYLNKARIGKINVKGCRIEDGVS